VERASLFERLKSGLEEAIAYERGEVALKTTEISLPVPPKLYTSKEIKQLREQMNLSQSTFARLLMVSTKTVQSWEQGVRSPMHSSLRLIQFIENPDLLSEWAKR